MATQELIQNGIKYFINYLPYMMAGVFVVAAFFRWTIYYTVKRHEWFAKAFETRVHKFIESEASDHMENVSYNSLSKKILEKTYYELFAIRDRSVHGNKDHVMTVSDRIYLVKQGCAWLVKDILKQLKHLKWSKETPKLQHITRATLHHNPCFNKVFGVFDMGTVNDLINILPGLFVVAGILGTFLGIKGGLVSLGGMDLSDIEGSKTIMDNFLHEIGFAMTSSIVGIVFSLSLHVINMSWSPERVYVSLVDRFESALDLLWYRSDNNVVPKDDEKFNENRDPVEALAEEALNLEIAKGKKSSAHHAA
jgi:hypothetical protein